MSRQLFDKIIIIGLGLMGGSIAKASKKNNISKQILGFDPNKTGENLALDHHIIDQLYRFDQQLSNKDLIVIAAPLSQYQKILKQLPSNNSLIIDIGSLKNFIFTDNLLCDHANNFIPCHPIAGSEKSGVINSDADLFVGKKVIITQNQTIKPDNIKKITEFWQKIGANVDFMDDHHHDKVFALVSHLPQLLSFIAQESYPTNNAILSQHFRLQGSNREIWQEIFSLNRENIRYYLDHYINILDQFLDNLTLGNLAMADCDDLILRRLILVTAFLKLPDIQSFQEYSGSGFKDFSAIATYLKPNADQPLSESQKLSLLNFITTIKTKIKAELNIL